MDVRNREARLQEGARPRLDRRAAPVVPFPEELAVVAEAGGHASRVGAADLPLAVTVEIRDRQGLPDGQRVVGGPCGLAGVATDGADPPSGGVGPDVRREEDFGDAVDHEVGDEGRPGHGRARRRVDRERSRPLALSLWLEGLEGGRLARARRVVVADRVGPEGNADAVDAGAVVLAGLAALARPVVRDAPPPEAAPSASQQPPPQASAHGSPSPSPSPSESTSPSPPPGSRQSPSRQRRPSLQSSWPSHRSPTPPPGSSHPAHARAVPRTTPTAAARFRVTRRLVPRASSRPMPRRTHRQPVGTARDRDAPRGLLPPPRATRGRPGPWSGDPVWPRRPWPQGRTR